MKIGLIFGLLAAAPPAAFAQAVIAGSVRDTSATPIAGVIVSATSPAIIEKTRSAVTDDAGRYRIEDLRPGVYQVTFTLPGWSPYYREGIELAGSFTATVNAELAIDRLTTTVTVEPVSRAVDVHRTHQEVTLSGELVRSIPTVRSYNALIGLLPGVTTSVNDVIIGTVTTSFPYHGGRTNEGRLLLDGLNVGSPPAGNSAASYVVDVGNTLEVTFSAAGSGDVETAGLVMNLVPRTGGNETHGSIFASGTGKRFHWDNVTPALKDAGFVGATPLTKVYDLSGSVGGSLVRDRVWYFLDAHTGGNTRRSGTVFYNLNAGNGAEWLYAPDASRREYSDRTFENGSVRVTWQVTPRNKIGGFWDAQSLCRRCTGATPGQSEPIQISPEAVGVLGRPFHVTQATWSSPPTDRLLLESGFAGTYFGVGNFERRPNPTRDLVRVVELCAAGCEGNGGISGLTYRSQDFSVAYTGAYLWKGSVTHVTGAGSTRAGYQHTFMTDDRTWMTNDQNLTYRFNNGLPDQLTQSISPWVNNSRLSWDALFLQHQWTGQRLTLQGALRFDRAVSWFPAQQEGPSRFLPMPIVIPKTKGVDSYKDLSPRVGAAYDLFGTGKTALRAAVGRYLEGAGISGNYANTNPTLRLPQTTMVFGTAGVTRAWSDANQNFSPDCDLVDPSAQDLRAAGGDFCGALSNANFGKNILTNSFDDGILNGWGIRPSDWTLSFSLEHRLWDRASVNVAYTRRWFHGFSIVDNTAVEQSDLTPFSVVAPVDPRLPGGGGFTISGLYDVSPEKFGQIDNLVTSSAKYGSWYQHFNAIDVNIDLRDVKGLTLVGGTSTGQTVSDNCEVRARLPELSTAVTGTSAFGPGLATSAVTPLSPYCHVASGRLSQFRGLASYDFPKAGLQFSAALQSKPGAMLAANYTVRGADVAPSLGRSLSGNVPNITINLVAPGTMYGDRINQLDLRVAKSLTFGRSRSTISLDVYNALNSSAVLAYNTAFIPNGSWLRPMAILTPRFIRLTAEIDI